MKKFLNFVKEKAGKLLLIGLIACVVTVILFNGKSGFLPPLAFLVSLLILGLGALGFALRILGSVAKGVKKISGKLASTIGKVSTATRNGKDIVTLYSAKGEKIDFREIAGIAYRGNFYAILQPVKLLEGMSRDEALVFKVTKGKNGEDNFEIELNDATVDAVFKEYNKLYDAQRKKR